MLRVENIVFTAVLVLIAFANLSAQTSPHGKDFKTDCMDCHVTDSWNVQKGQMKFDHSETGFQLVGQHSIVDCRSCHAELKFTGADQACFSCHRDVHENSVEQDCAKCHSPKTWIVENVNMLHEQGRFPLLGSHLSADCADCHASYSNLNFETLGVNCIDCHRRNYLSTTAPDHVQAQYSTDCTECHLFTASEWGGASIVHDFFPLTAGHEITDCFACHSTNSFTGLSRECYQCHQSNYESTTKLDHQSLGLPKNCELCHTTNPGWKPAQFTLHDNFYQLLGAHAKISTDCGKCHTTADYKAAPTECFGCHEANYNSTSNPSHSSANFSHDCALCHSQNAWKPSTFDHDSQYFPIYSGEHKGKWNTCGDCHISSADYSQFSCINCHEHNNKAKVDDDHRGISNYSYTPTSCYDCHPTGKEGDDGGD